MQSSYQLLRQTTQWRNRQNDMNRQFKEEKYPTVWKDAQIH